MTRKLVHTESIPIRWGDMDAQRHVNNTVYFRYMEQARISLFDKLGVRSNGSGIPVNLSPVVITASCTYMKALVYPGTVEVSVEMGDPGRTSVMVYYAMRPSYDRDTVYAEGSSKQCWVDLSVSKAAPLPAAIRELIREPSGGEG